MEDPLKQSYALGFRGLEALSHGEERAFRYRRTALKALSWYVFFTKLFWSALCGVEGQAVGQLTKAVARERKSVCARAQERERK